MAGDAAATRKRILDAAIAEFSAYGIAGARVDRIAASSGNNKAMIYKYFGNKDQLFDAVFDAIVVQTMRDVPLDPEDLPGYAVRLWDAMRQDPDPLRIGDWDRLERGSAGMALEAVRASDREKQATIAEAQRRGLADDSIPAPILLGQILALTRIGLTTDDPEAQRAAIRVAVGRLISPAYRSLSA